MCTILDIMILNVKQKLILWIILIAVIFSTLSAIATLHFNKKISMENAQLINSNIILNVSNKICRDITDIGGTATPSGTNTNVFGNIYILNSLDDVEDHGFIDKDIIEYHLSLNVGYAWIESRDKTYLLNSVHDEVLSLYFYSIRPETVVLKSYYEVKKTIVFIAIIRTLVVGLIFFIITGHIIRPVEVLTSQMLKYINNRGRVDIENEIKKTINSTMGKHSEVGLLSDTFIELIESQKRLIKELHEKDRTKVLQESKSKEYLSTIINSLPFILISIDGNKNITRWNRKAEEFSQLSVESVAGEPLMRILPCLGPFDNNIDLILNSQNSKSYEEKNVKWTDLYVNIVITPLSSHISKGAIIRIEDVTEKRKIGELLIQNEKMLSVGGLAAGMAHEINNPLGGMMQNSEVIKNRLYDKLDIPVAIKAAEDAGTTIEAIKKFIEIRNIPNMLDKINESGMFIRDIISNMLGFSKKVDDIASFSNLKLIISKALNLASGDSEDDKEFYFKNIDVIKDFPEDFPEIQCDAVKIQQVILNILINASHAMNNTKTEHPKIVISFEHDIEKNRAVIKIKDNGPGMFEEVRRRVFEPFYTTKRSDLGTGLGLSISYFIISENHHGELSVESSPGKGSEFIISIPIVQ